jgi:hypothetical protein
MSRHATSHAVAAAVAAVLAMAAPVHAADPFGNGTIKLPTTASGGTGTVANLQTDDDVNYAAAKGATASVGGFGTHDGAITSVYLFVQYSVETGYSGSNPVQVNGVNTTIVPAQRDYGRWAYVDITGGAFGIDTSAGISDNVTRLLIASQQIIVVSSPDPTAIVDAYALIKIVLQLDPTRQMRILINSVTGSQEAEQIFAQLSRVTQRFLAREIRYLGYVQLDEKLSEAVRAQRAVVLEFPFSASSRCFRALAKTLIPSESSEVSS